MSCSCKVSFEHPILVTVEWSVAVNGRIFRLDVDADEAGEPVACRTADSDEAFPVEEFRRQLGDEAQFFHRFAARAHAALRRAAGIEVH